MVHQYHDLYIIIYLLYRIHPNFIKSTFLCVILGIYKFYQDKLKKGTHSLFPQDQLQLAWVPENLNPYPSWAWLLEIRIFHVQRYNVATYTEPGNVLLGN